MKHLFLGFLVFGSLSLYADDQSCKVHIEADNLSESERHKIEGILKSKGYKIVDEFQAIHFNTNIHDESKSTQGIILVDSTLTGLAEGSHTASSKLVVKLKDQVWLEKKARELKSKTYKTQSLKRKGFDQAEDILTEVGQKTEEKIMDARLKTSADLPSCASFVKVI